MEACAKILQIRIGESCVRKRRRGMRMVTGAGVGRVSERVGGRVDESFAHSHSLYYIFLC